MEKIQAQPGEAHSTGDNDQMEPSGMETSIPGIIAIIGELPPGAIVYEQGLAELFSRHPTSIKRAVQRGELPPPVRMFGTNAWTAGALVQHIEKRLGEAASRQEKFNTKIRQLNP